MDEHLNTHPESPGVTEGRRSLSSQPRIRLGAVIALAIAAGVIAWVVLRDDNSSNPSATEPTTTTATANTVGPVALSARGLATLAREIRQPIYWAGPKPGYTYELTRTSNGSVFIRYLPEGVKPGVKTSRYLIVATYPFTKAYGALQQVAKGDEIKLPGGGIALVDAKYPKSVHLAYRGVNFQVEVYDPSPARALEVASSGNVAPAR